MRPNTLADVSEAQWSALARRAVFFGHQSVGANIMAGVADILAQQPRLPLEVTESKQLVGSAGFRHAAIGRNDHPLEKMDEFVALADGLGPDGIALMKLCYVDAHTHTDPATLFAEYQRRVAELRTRNPGLTIVHVTMPLTGIENWKGRVRATLTGHAMQRDRNVVRHRYSELMRAAYAGREPLFDLARLESTLPNGERTAYRAGGDTVPLLAARYSDDGGHLNAESRRMVAERLLVLLARLPRSGGVVN